MKKLLLLCLLLGLGKVCYAQAAGPILGQPTQVVNKFVGDNVVIAWDFDVTEEFLGTAFSIKMVDDLTKTSIELKQVAKNLRTTSFPATYTTGLQFTYFAVTFVNGTTSETAPSNTVAIKRVGKPPTNNRITN